MARIRAKSVPGAPPFATRMPRGPVNGKRGIRRLQKVDVSRGITMPEANLLGMQEIHAWVETALTGANNDLRFTSREPGADGNGVRIRYVDTGTNVPLDVTVSGRDITVQLATAADVNEVQTVTVDATGGTYTLSFGGQTTAPIAFDAAAATVQTALRALSSIGSPNVTVTGSAGGPYTVTFVGTLAAQNVAQMTANSTSLTGNTHTTTVTTATPGAGVSATTAAQVAAAVNADAEAGPLVTASLAFGNDGTGVVAAMGYLTLAGGVDGNPLLAGPGTSPATASPRILRKPVNISVSDFRRRLRDRSANRSLLKR